MLKIFSIEDKIVGLCTSHLNKNRIESKFN